MSTYPPAEPPAAYHGSNGESNDYEKGPDEKYPTIVDPSGRGDGTNEYDVMTKSHNPLQRKLKSRHMQMIAIGGAIGAGLFVGSGSVLASGGPGSIFIGFIIIGVMIYFVMQALAELGVMYPVNGAFFTYAYRFISPSWGFAVGWDYAIQWLTVLPFEITAATLTLDYWKASRNINPAAWVGIFLFVLIIIQIFGIRGYGEVEFFLSIIKITACTGFIILGIIIDCGGVPTDPRGYIGGRYWTSLPAFKNGFYGFCGVFVNAAFSFAGTELTGLAAAEAADPLKSIPLATKQVVWRIAFFYIVSLLLVGLIVPADNPHLLNASDSATKYSPFVLAIKLARIPKLPGIFNGVITISVISVANSCTFGSTRTLQALAARDMAPKFFAYIDKRGRPVWCVLLQLAFGLLAFTIDAHGNSSQTFFDWLLALSGVGQFFLWGSIAIAHVRFRKAWKYHGHTLEELPFRASAGIWGSYFAIFLCVICLMASFYTAVYPKSAYDFFEAYLAGPLILVLWLFWKIWTREWFLLTNLADIDVSYGTRTNLEDLQAAAARQRHERSLKNIPMRVIHTLF